MVRIGTTLSSGLENALVDFLRGNKDIFAWKPSDILGILREVTKHTLKIHPGSKPVKQCLCRFDEEKRRAISEEIAKLSAARFVTTWVFGEAKNTNFLKFFLQCVKHVDARSN